MWEKPGGLFFVRARTFISPRTFIFGDILGICMWINELDSDFPTIISLKNAEKV